jgi:hypothetical protein
VIKGSQLMILRSRISMILEISGHSKDGHIPPRQWQADMNVQWKLRHHRPHSGNFGQDKLGTSPSVSRIPPRTPTVRSTDLQRAGLSGLTNVREPSFCPGPALGN